MVKVKFTVEISASASKKQTEVDIEKEAQQIVEVLKKTIQEVEKLPNQIVTRT